MNSYTRVGLAFALTGALLSIVSYFVLSSTPLTALGISTLILASVSFAVGSGQPKIPPEVSAVLMQSGAENISALVEELSLKSKAIYLPSSMTSGKPLALIPLDSNLHLPQLGKKAFPKRLIVRLGSNPENFGLLVTTPGSAASDSVVSKPDSTESDLESALSTVLSSRVNLADGSAVAVENDVVRVEVSNPRLEERKMWIYESLGSPLSSIVASVIAQALDKPVIIEDEQRQRGRCVLQLRLLRRDF